MLLKPKKKIEPLPTILALGNKVFFFKNEWEIEFEENRFSPMAKTNNKLLCTSISKRRRRADDDFFFGKMLAYALDM